MSTVSPRSQSGVEGELPSGEGRTAATLLPLVYEELRMIARARLRSLPAGASLQATDLLHEAYARLARRGGALFETRRHFVAAAAMAMRSVLIDHARARNAAKRGGAGTPRPLDGLAVELDRPPEELLALDAALEKLEAVDSRSAQVVIFRFYMGLQDAQIADVLGITDRTVRRDWVFARQWLQRELARSGPGAPAGPPLD